MEYDQQVDGMFCEVCKKYGKTLASARGAWVTKPISNWVKATELLKQHEMSEWHLASVEVQVMASLASTSGGTIADRLIAIGEEERKNNRDVVTSFLRSFYFLFKNSVPHTTTMFQDVIQLQIDNSLEQLKKHKELCPSNNVTYLSPVTTADFLPLVKL